MVGDRSLGDNDGGGAPLARLIERVPGGTGCGGADPPAGDAEATAVPSHDDGAGMSQRRVERRLPAAVDDHRGAQQPVEDRPNLRPAWPHVSQHRLA